MSDQKLHQDKERSARAEALLRNELLSEAFEAFDADYLNAWRATNIRDTEARERLFQAVHILGKVRDHLAGVVANGKLAQCELDELANRRKRFGVM
jgi:hypothetical protein